MGQDNGTSQKSAAKESKETTSTKNRDATSSEDQNVSNRGNSTSDILEDEPLIADLTSIIDKDGIGEANVVWKISNDGNVYRSIPGATNQSFTPRQEHVGKR